MRILVIEDDSSIADVIRRTLVTQHYLVDITGNGRTGMEMALSNDYDLIILDLMLPGMDGREVCREIRRQECKAPVLMLTALSAREDVIEGLDRGADDYLSKPFDIGILMARVRSLTRRTSDQKSTAIEISDMKIDTARRLVTRAGETITLTPKEFALLEYFVMNQGKIISRAEISEHVWDMNFDPRSNVIDSLVRFLRQKIDREPWTPMIHTVRGSGYQFDADRHAV